MIRIKCHGHKCRDKDRCPFYSPDRVEGDGEQGNDEVECDIIRQYKGGKDEQRNNNDSSRHQQEGH